MSFESARELLTDPFKTAIEGPMRSHVGESRMQLATVVGPYDAQTNTVPIILHNAPGRPVSYPIRTRYQGPHPGTGEAVEVYPGQLVHVMFENGQSTGLISKGVIDLAYYTGKDKPAPMSASWNNPDTTGGTVKVLPAGADGRIGKVEHIDNESNEFHVALGEIHRDEWGNQSVLFSGSNETQNARDTRKASKKLNRTADKLMEA